MDCEMCIRDSNKAVVFMNNCLITGNSVRELFGVGIQISSGHICMNNTTIVLSLIHIFCNTPVLFKKSPFLSFLI